MNDVRFERRGSEIQALPRYDAGMAKRGRPKHPDVLTPAEWRVVDGVRHGMTNRQIAARRGTSLDAVKAHVESARAKLGLGDRLTLRFWPGVPAGSALTKRGESMSEPLRLSAIGQIARVVRDTAVAEAWFRDVLGLKHLFTYGTLAFFDCDGTRLFLTQPEGDHGLVEQECLYFRVEDIHAAQAELEGRGVVFKGAPHMIFKHEGGLEEWMAFFEDVDGWTLALMAQVQSAQ